MPNKKIFISTSSFSQNDPAPLKALHDAGFDVTLNPYNRKLSKEEARLHYASYDGLIAGLETLDEAVLSASSLKVLSRCGAGMANVDLEAAKRLNIKVFSTPDAPTIAVAELTLAALLSILRRLTDLNASMHAGQWQKIIGVQLSGKTVVIIGLGRIGRKVAHLLKAFEANVIAVDPLVKAMDGVTMMAKEQALPLADIVSLHVSGDELVLGDAEFDLFKKGVILLNVSRGEVLSEPALINGLNSGKIAGVWCDVFSQEPYQGALLKYPQALLTPHVGSYTNECRSQMEMEAVNNLIKGFRN